MSNPIGDSADYFIQRNQLLQQQQQQGGSSPDVLQGRRQEGVDAPLSDDPRKKASTNARLANPTRRIQSSTNPAFDARHQWQRVMEKLAMGQGGGSGEHSTSTTPTHSDIQRHSHPNRRYLSHHYSLSQHPQRHSSYRYHDDSESDENNSYEMQPTRDAYTEPDEDDDALPSPTDLERERQASLPPEGEPSYFAHPFQLPPSIDTEQETVQPSRHDEQEQEEGAHEEEEEQAGPSHQEPTRPEQAHVPGHHARMQWSKTLDKIRLISNIQHLPSKPSPPAPHEPSNSLAPYFQPAFEAPFIALSRDEHGRKLPPILLQCLNVNITDSELVNYYGIKQHLFRVELQYGDIKWVIKKTIGDFVALHVSLKVKAPLTDHVPAPPSFPNQLQNFIQSARTTMGMDDEERDTEKERKQALARRKALTRYLRELLKRSHIMVSYDICEFLEISAISIVQDMGWKGKEGYLENRVNFVDTRVCHMFRRYAWKKEWVILRDSYIAFCEDVASTSPTDVFMFDKSLYVFAREPGLFSGYHDHITMENNFRRFTIRGSKRQVGEWMESVKKVQQESPWVKNHRFGSFAPIRHHAKVKWFIDGEDHFNAVAEAILSARSEIYIADWWLSPELYLRRPPAENEDFRIDRLLQRKAEEGVMIYIIVYKEVEAALTIDSAHTKKWLQKLHPNILVQRHPDHRNVNNVVLFWSHHEKMVIVDNRLAFIGGLDLCYGRWDTHQHRLADVPVPGNEHIMVPGQDYSNPRVKDFANVEQWDTTLVDRNVIPRMPWHDCTIGVVGPIARDIARHFIQRWNYLKASKGMHRPNLPFLMPKGEYVAARDESKFKGTCRVQLLRSSAEWSSGIEREHSIYNAYMECITKAKHYIYIENQFFISTTTDDKLLRNKIGQAMLERIKRAHKNGEKFKIFILIPLIPAFEGDLATSEASSARSVMHFEYISISRGGNSIIEKLQEAGINPSDYIGWYSLRTWDKINPNRPPPRTNNASKVDSGAELHDDNGSKSTSPPNSARSFGHSNSHITEGSSFTISEDEKDQFVSELIYIHDKLMIVDDRLVIIGSGPCLVIVIQRLPC
ncbi:phospholipase d1 [Lichtheimia corymbifera JMRC:FSU:9682]|uniref:Phospholipase n=1 Tax=Lichtheimia corymbifera JMRC:FSU:9682 TaxID=1263082 RepID=A0A068RLK0_9FUNG|nr:phospholipase d1 [Lichtheimia corymbifera JMRC:FSU:9682]